MRIRVRAAAGELRCASAVTKSSLAAMARRYRGGTRFKSSGCMQPRTVRNVTVMVRLWGGEKTRLSLYTFDDEHLSREFPLISSLARPAPRERPSMKRSPLSAIGIIQSGNLRSNGQAAAARAPSQ